MGEMPECHFQLEHCTFVGGPLCVLREWRSRHGLR